MGWSSRPNLHAWQQDKSTFSYAALTPLLHMNMLNLQNIKKFHPKLRCYIEVSSTRSQSFV